ncbi:hypothetical protein FQN57_007512 [Myotisia sp. PD_48]|nr:hypothetical protein FQN57_007512 [Myotisia sp. PD_48]
MSAEAFPDLPPFPNDVPTAPLLRLSLARLLSRDPVEFNRFCNACEDVGFFYLDLRGEPNIGSPILQHADQMFRLGEYLFNLDLEEKQKYDFSAKNSYFGYKGYGKNIVDKDGNTDRNEFYNISKDDIFEISDPLPAPDLLTEHRLLTKNFMSNAHSIVLLVLELLNEHLQLAPSILTDMHRIYEPAGDQVRIVKAPPQPSDDRRTAMGQHTDFGSVTVLFNRVGGLQILPPGEQAEWCYVKPLPGHAIINLGDALVKFTNGLLRSNIHRVISPPGEQASVTRYSLVYFSRPEDAVMLKRLEGSSRIPPLEQGVVEEEICSKDWVLRRGLGGRINLHKNIDYDKNRGTEMQSRRIKV